jgi:hypothetical protein
MKKRPSFKKIHWQPHPSQNARKIDRQNRAWTRNSPSLTILGGCRIAAHAEEITRAGAVDAKGVVKLNTQLLAA